MASAFSGLRVLDASESIAGQYCARLLADYGATVTLAEPPAGSATRSESPWLFRHLNTGKTVTAIDLDDEAALIRAADGADIVIIGSPRHRDVAQRAAPAAIIATITGFGLDGPLADWRGSEMIYQAFSSSMPSNGAADQPPLYGCGNRASYAAGVAAYCGIVAADLERRRSGISQDVDIAIAEVAAAMTTGAVAYGYTGRVTAKRTGSRSLIEAGGEWVLLWCYPYQWPDFCAALDSTDLEDDPRFAEHNTRAKNWGELMAILQERHRDTPGDELVARIRARRLITAKAQRLSALQDDSHLAARGFWRTTGRSNDLSLAPPFRIKGTTGTAKPVASEPETSLASPMPLDGIRILDLTTAWAGPMAGRVLGFLGAGVIHLEHATKPDLWRHHRQVYNPALYAGSDESGPRYNRNALFNSQNINKRSLSLDLKAPAGRAVAQRIARQCDVILTNFTPGTIDRLGLGHAELSADNPGIIVCQMPAYGLTGPDSAALAVGATMELASGMASLVGYRDGPPVTTGPNYPDPIGGFNAAAAILTALAQRERTGRGAHVEVPQLEAAMQFIGVVILEAIETGRDPIRDGNHVRTHAPHNVYPARDPDSWIAISAPDTASWWALCDLIDPTLATDPKFASPESRLEHQADLDALIAAWSAQRDKYEAAAQLQGLGIPAAPVLDASELARHQFFRHRSAFVTLSHPEAGLRGYQTMPIHLNRTPGHDRAAAPTLGQHTDEILAEFGVSADEREALARDGVTANIPA
jgi:crotonobetainyl-CoA:carnitine CoA-transferase CaiB-like acyl-CoA transferase